LWQAYAAKPERGTRDALIAQYAPLVKYVIGRLRLTLPPALDESDVLGYGTIGLIEAVDRFDPERGVKFETYAIPRIRGAIIDAVRALDLVPRSARERGRDIERAYQALFTQRGAMPTEQEVADALGMTHEQLRDAMRDTSCTLLPLEGDGREDGVGLESTLSDERAVEPLAAAVQSDAVERLAQALDRLEERDRLIVSLYYYEELTMKEIGEVLDVTESRVSQLLTRIRFQLRALLQAQGMTSFDLPA
jgi:RNA polymerase sigma factor for flagellar operon FliA